LISISKIIQLHVFTFAVTTLLFAPLFLILKVYVYTSSQYVKALSACALIFVILLNIFFIRLAPFVILNYIFKFIILFNFFDNFRKQKYPYKKKYTKEWLFTLCEALGDAKLRLSFLDDVCWYVLPVMWQAFLTLVFFYCLSVILFIL